MAFTLIRVALDPILKDESPLLIFALPVMICARIGGLWPGIVATLFGAIVGGLLFIAPHVGPAHDMTIEFTRYAIFLSEGFLISLLSHQLHKSLQEKTESERHYREASEHLKESEERVKSIVDTVVDAVITIDETGAVVWWNRASERIFGYEAKEIIGKNLKILMPEPYQSEHDSYITNYLRTGEKKIIGIGREVLGRRKDGSIFPIDLAVSEFVAGNRRYFTGLVRDITARIQEAEALKQAKDAAEAGGRAKSQFVANVSHEIRTPLGVIIGFTDLALEQEHNPPETQRFLESIQRNALQLADLIDSLLDLSRAEEVSLHIEKARFDLSTLLEELKTRLGPKARAKGLTFTIESEGPIPNGVQSDPSRLKQVLLNLLDNAIKFTPAGSVSLVIRNIVPNDALAPTRLEFEVRDTGIGIAPNEQKHLFEPFAQGDPSMSRRFGGTGIGLVLSRRFAQALGGDLILKSSAPGNGCVFVASILTAPAGKESYFNIIRQDMREGSSLQRLPSDPVTKPAKSAQPSGRLRLEGRRLLLVEDSPDNRAMVARFLSKEGAKVEWAEDGNAGIKKAMAIHPDLVLMDIQMPVCDGYNATILLRKQGFAQPIVALTAHAMLEERERSLRSGFDEYLTKPVNRDQLIETVRRLTERGHV